jgi:hypothetical protein
MITEFQRDAFGRRSAEFWSWLQEHHDAYFINLSGAKAGRIHRADCPHMKFPQPRGVNFVSRGKLCAPTRRELQREADARAIALKPCPDCDRLDREAAG